MGLELTFEALDPVEDGLGQDVGLRSRRADQGDLEGDAGLGGVAHCDDCPADEFHHPYAADSPQRVDDLGGVAASAGSLSSVCRADEREEVATEPFDESDSQLGGVTSLADGPVDRKQGSGDVTCGECRHERRQGVGVVIGGATGRHLVEHREASRAEPRARRTTESSTSAASSMPGVAGDRGDEGRELALVEEVELVVLGPAAQRRQYLCGSVVASTNTTRSGGSSSVFSSVFDAGVESMWTSSTM